MAAYNTAIFQSESFDDDMISPVFYFCGIDFYFGLKNRISPSKFQGYPLAIKIQHLMMHKNLCTLP